ncbi:SAF domain-containing protein [Kitasatospora sp. MBT63]|uniref:SAF domain-containing protein n=1 Tax=Kitasatospora sp. MBT63 TaxID=1444768 RepID=UPI001E63AA40|nr:SAF domain-containing protein [Kitasatospora sp. MBT63]
MRTPMARSTTKQRTDPATDSAPASVPITESAPRRGRRPALVGIGVAVAVVGALGGWSLVDQARDRVQVLAVARPVPAGQAITAADLVAAEVAPDPALRPVAVSRSKEIVGKTAATDLVPGSLITTQSVREGKPVTTGRDVVGILTKPGQMPQGRLQIGDAVILVATPRQDDTKADAQPATINAVVARVGDADGNGVIVVDVAVSPVDSPSVAAWTASGRIGIVLKAKS